MALTHAYTESGADAAVRHPGPDFAEHERTFHGFMHLGRWFIAHLALLVLGLYSMVYGGSNLFGGFLVMLAVIAFGYGVVSTPAAAEKLGDRAVEHEDAEGNPIIHA